MCEAVLEERPIALKVCSKCHVAKPLASFSKNRNRNRNNSDGLQSCCKSYMAKLNKSLNEKNKSRKTIVIPDSKECPRCGIEKPGSSFNKSSTPKDGLQIYCRECEAMNKMRSRYGITEEWYKATLDAQDGGCAICKTKTPGGRGHWHVDHIHGTDIVRGLLCNNCNLSIGLFRDSSVFINLAIEYLAAPTTGILYNRNSAKKLRNEILVTQNYMCKICSIDLHNKKVDLDHCYKTGFIRGCLCNGCNCGLGQFDESIEALTNAIAYLQKYEGLRGISS
jgi:hypothetical protein